jgi:hypothetical protein
MMVQEYSVSPAFPQARKGEQVLVWAGDVVSLFAGFGLMPFIKTRTRHKATPFFKGRPERGFFAECFGAGIDQVVVVFAVFCPGRHQAPMCVAGLQAAVRQLGDVEDGLTGRDVAAGLVFRHDLPRSRDEVKSSAHKFSSPEDLRLSYLLLIC